MPAITQSDMQVACATASFVTESLLHTAAVECSNRTNCIHSTAEADTRELTVSVNPNAASFFDSEITNSSHAVISFSTPFIFIPSTGATENYGYVPQSLIDWMVNDPGYHTQYSGLASCLPGGPVIVKYIPGWQPPLNIHMGVHIGVHIGVSTLTSSTTVTITSAGCFAPGACPISETTSPAPGSTASPPSLPSASSAVTTAVLEKIPLGKASLLLSPSVSTNTALPLSPISILQTFSSPAPSPQVTAPTTTAVISQPIAISVITVGSSTITANPASHFLIAGQTLAPGGPPIIVSGSELSLAPSATALVVNGVILPQTTAMPQGLGAVIASVFHIPPPLVIGSESITANAASQYVVGSKTIMPGAAPVVISGSTYSLAPLATLVEANDVPTPLREIGGPMASAVAVAPAIAFGSMLVTANSASRYVIGSQTLVPGAPAVVVSGTTVSLGPSANDVVIAGSTLHLSSAFGYIVGSQTIVPGAPQITISGIKVSLAPSGNDVVLDGNATALASGGAAPVITIGSQLITANAASQYIVGSQTLVPGAAITVSGTVISLAPSASDLVVGGTTITLAAGGEPVITIGSQLITANAASQYIVGSQTLVPGAAITVSGTIISLAPSASDLVVGGTTMVLSSPTGAGDGSPSKGNALHTNPDSKGEGIRMSLGLMSQTLGLCFGMLILLFL